MRSPALWLYLLGGITILSVVLRRVLRRQTPLNDELFSMQIAVDHVQSGVAMVQADGLVRSINPALAKMVGLLPREILGQSWMNFFPPAEGARVNDAYSQALLMGKIALQTHVQRSNGTLAQVDLLIVTVHDHKSRLVGHYCLMDDRTREVVLEERIRTLTADGRLPVQSR